jgi:aspartate ammonia-lyase
MTRVEHDLLGELEVPAHAYWGIHTLRAVENFPITGVAIGELSDLVRALAQVKHAAASANHALGELDEARFRAIATACGEIVDGRLHEQFRVDVIQGGAGTSTNMNANEVIANRALELMGHKKGEYHILHPIEHVNRSQSTNDVYPTALRLASIAGIRRLLARMEQLRLAFEAKAAEFSHILKIGRTQLQDAVPMTLGQEFSTYAVMLGEDQARLTETLALLREISLGATAIGTGINTDPAYAGLACAHLAQLSGESLITSPNLVEATQDTGAFVQVSGVLKRVAVKLSKICNDLRLLSSGPQCGFNEIRLPERAAGSSIMVGKVNPVIPEVVNQIAFEVVGNDITITMASEGGQLQLNAFEPIIGWSLFKSIKHLTHGCATLAEHCVAGITANEDVLAERVRTSVVFATALNPYIGYENATRVARAALQSGRGVVELVRQEGLLSEARLAEVLRPENLVRPQRLTGEAESA